MSIITVGDKVRASYKTGIYLGEVVELSAMRAAVRVLAVLKHPAQGDLHQAHRTSMPLFYQRRALSFREIALMPLPTVTLYEGSIPEYRESLQKALRFEISDLEQKKEFAEKSLAHLRELEEDYQREAAKLSAKPGQE